jgi:hypothetical protein
MTAFVVASRRKTKRNPDDIIGQSHSCKKCIKCLKPSTSIGGGYVLLGSIRVIAGWCEEHGGSAPGLVGDKNGNCWGGWHEKYGIKTTLISRG